MGKKDGGRWWLWALKKIRIVFYQAVIKKCDFFVIFCLINFFYEYISIFREQDGSLAQLEEHLVYTERVGSSNLSTPTN